MNINQFDQTEEIVDYEEQDYESEEFEYATRNDGWWAVILLASIVYGIEMIVHTALPPFRSTDIIIIFLLLIRWMKTRNYYGGFLLSYRIRRYSIFMLILTFMLLFSLVINVLGGRYSFFYKDLFTPIVFIRMIIIGSLTASLNLGPRQIRQILVSLLFIALGLVILAFGQKYHLFGIGSTMERFYVARREMFETQMAGGLAFARVVGTFGNPNVFGGCMVMLAAMALAFAINLKGLNRWMSIIVYVGLSAAIILTTASRTSLVSLFVISSISVILSLRKGSRLPALFIAVLVGGVLLFVQNNVHDLPLHPKIQLLLGGGETALGQGFTSRYGMWKESWANTQESFIFGIGPTKTTFQLTDNGYLFTLQRIGIVGLVVYLSMIITLLVTGLKRLFHENQMLQRTFLLGLIMVIINHMIFEITGEFFWRIRYGALISAFFGLLCGLSAQIDQEITAQDNYVYPEEEAV